MEKGHNINLEAMAIVRKDGVEQRRYSFTPTKNDAVVGYQIIDKETGEVRAQKEQPMKSWVYNWCKFLYQSMSGTSQTYYRTSGTSTTTFPYYWSINSMDLTNSNHGIHAGSDDGTITPLSANNYVLGDRYLEGASAGEFNYDTTAVVPAALDNVVKYKVRLSRYINNYSPNSNVVKELSVVGLGSDGNYTTYIRDLFTSNGNLIDFTVKKSEALLVYYDLFILKDSGFTKNIVRWIEAIAKADNTVALKNISNADITATAATTVYNLINCNAGAAIDNYGVVIGRGENENDFDRVKLVSRINEGVGANELNHGATTFTAPSHVSGQQEFKVHRIFSNNSGATITTKEIALYGKGTGSSNRTCFARVDMIGVPVLTGETLEIVFTIRTLI